MELLGKPAGQLVEECDSVIAKQKLSSCVFLFTVLFPTSRWREVQHYSSYFLIEEDSGCVLNYKGF